MCGGKARNVRNDNFFCTNSKKKSFKLKYVTIRQILGDFENQIFYNSLSGIY